ncbi:MULTISPECIES: alpha/beta fold hydrolase [unclassified Coleofasciculus]|uniref:alpha/beta fold hydrolase n=1 Tax=unclassified Coleofasciculus TaxID=2692782 RepID=UPI00187FE4C0|nr:MULTISPECIES: alpha/beta hydrolase [unclassified Coleofasciculus]MBE9128792.1 alpha/beta hydrolase [Coleofasciculus sp. LEGE 07081]MBE9151502.1 alpha/beta hydrolase [Coleofasciculus sp. LEGE 07092]
MTKAPDFILFAQHGWADTHRTIATMAKVLATSQTLVITPYLGWFKTWWRIEPLVEKVEQIATETIARYPHTPIRIIGHSMGGLIWLEVLTRHPEWWQKVESLVLIASPVGGADLARIFDPLGVGIGIAGALGINRRQMAQVIAKTIPTLVIAGDIDEGSDGTITIGTTTFAGAKFVSLPRLSHAKLKNHPAVVELIREFWANPGITNPPSSDFAAQLIEHLQSVPGMMDAHCRDFRRAKTYMRLANGLSIHIWTHPLQIEHVFVGNSSGECLYGGFVGWMHRAELRKALDEVETLYATSLHKP